MTARTVLRTRADLRSMTGPGHVVVEGAPFVASSGSTLPLAVHDHWVAVLDPADPVGGDVEVVFLLHPEATGFDDLLSDARERVPELVEGLRARHGGRTASVTPSPEPQDDYFGPVGGDQAYETPPVPDVPTRKERRRDRRKRTEAVAEPPRDEARERDPFAWDDEPNEDARQRPPRGDDGIW